jgi:hypothetical protein
MTMHTVQNKKESETEMNKVHTMIAYGDYGKADCPWFDFQSQDRLSLSNYENRTIGKP